MISPMRAFAKWQVAEKEMIAASEVHQWAERPSTDRLSVTKVTVAKSRKHIDHLDMRGDGTRKHCDAVAGPIPEAAFLALVD